MFNRPKKIIYQYEVNLPKDIKKPYSSKFLISPLFLTAVVNVSLIAAFAALGFYIGIIGSLNHKKLYGDHCSVDSDCETGFNLRCQNGNCNCTTSTFYNQSLMLCTSKQLNAIPCSNDQECCCNQKCAYDSTKKISVCSCTTDRWWNTHNSSCQKKSFFNEACSSSDQCLLETNLVCLSNKCVCSDASLNFWNGTFCDSVQSFMGKCRISQGCNPAQGLICNITEQYPYKCTCPPFNYWNSALSLCKTQKTNNDSCGATDECKSDTGLYCHSVCKCLDNFFWSTDKCIKKMNYGESCSGLLQCDDTIELDCVNSYCACKSNSFWNGSFCVSLISNGFNCDNYFKCDSNLGLRCDATNKKCVCLSSHYWSDISERCKLKEINGIWCTHSIQCQTENGLDCVNNHCVCAYDHFWSGTECNLKRAINLICNFAYQCQDFKGLTCLGTATVKTCRCVNQQYWNGTICVNRLSFNESCGFDSECSHQRGLACYEKCLCSSQRYWNGNYCVLKKEIGEECTADFQCNSDKGLLCISGNCSCMALTYWSEYNCEFKQSVDQFCNYSNPECQDYAGLQCIDENCLCSSSQYWVTNKCQSFVGINQLCDNSTYYCEFGLTCQGSAPDNYICQCPPVTYWNGSQCLNVKTFNESCDGWNVPCDHSKKLRCLLEGEGSSCLQDYSGYKCNCVSTSYWNGSTCIPKLLDHDITNVSCECRQDLGLESFPFESDYSCYNDKSPSWTCACQNTKFWTGEKCVPKKTQNDSCINSCQCKENLLLKCLPFTNGFSCYGNFSSGKRCLCEPVTQWWNSSTCVDKFNINTACTENCQCREDLGLTCQLYNAYQRYSCTTSYSNSQCQCDNLNHYWSGNSTGCVDKFKINTVCTENCQCREDLGLTCKAYSSDSCLGSYSNNECDCSNVQYWDGSKCVDKFNINTACTENCQCREDLGLSCQLDNAYVRYSCTTSYSNSQCQCNNPTHYWSSSLNRCVSKNERGTSCSTSCECKENLGLICKAYSLNSCLSSYPNKRCDCSISQYWNGSQCVSKKTIGQNCSKNCECSSLNCNITCR